jgi:predicted nucleotidyltransferase
MGGLLFYRSDDEIDGGEGMNRIEKNEEIQESALKEFTVSLREKLAYNLVSVVLFGSYARGDMDESSDLDILIILEEYEEIESALIDTCVRIVLDYGVSIAPITWDIEDLNANIKYKSPLFLTLLLGHKIWYDKNNFFENKIREIKKEEIPEFSFVGRHKEWRSSEISL